MKKILIFGTGGSAEKLMENAGSVYQIIGFADNDTRKHGKRFHDLPIYAPAEIPNLAFDQIIIASMWFSDIRDQLIEKIGVDEKLIGAIPKVFASEGKKYRPFEDEETRQYAARVLQHVVPFLEQRGIPCYVDHGTLIGLVRDDCIMPWDDDIDLSVAYTDRHRLFECVPELVATMPDAHAVHWQTDLIYNNIDEVIALFFTVEDPSGRLHPFNAGISFYTIESGLAIEAINWAPAHHYSGGEQIQTSLGRFRVPNDYRDYLTTHYGAWETPVQDMSFGQIDNFKKREAPAQWIAWNPEKEPSPEALIAAVADSILHGSFLYLPLSMAANVPSAPRIFADWSKTAASLRTLAQYMHVNRAFVCGMDPGDSSAGPDILHQLTHIGISDTVGVEMDMQDQPADALWDAMTQHEMVRWFHKAASWRRHDPPVCAADFCTDEMRNGIRFFRCRYKKYWIVWNTLLARCPHALRTYLIHNGQGSTADVFEIDPDRADLKSALLAFLRRRPCDGCHDCASNDSVWRPFARYDFSVAAPSGG